MNLLTFNFVSRVRDNILSLPRQELKFVNIDVLGLQFVENLSDRKVNGNGQKNVMDLPKR